jgi:hypothetical protein
MKIAIFTIVLLCYCNVLISQEVGSKYQGGIVIAPGIIINPIKFTDYVNPKYNKNLFSYEEAVLKCKRLKTNGYNDWRVPSIVDLQNIHLYAEDNRVWGGYPEPIEPGFTYISSSTKKNDSFIGPKVYRYLFYMVSTKALKKLNPSSTNIELRSLDATGRLIAVRYFR